MDLRLISQCILVLKDAPSEGSLEPPSLGLTSNKGVRVGGSGLVGASLALHLPLGVHSLVQMTHMQTEQEMCCLHTQREKMVHSTVDGKRRDEMRFVREPTGRLTNAALEMTDCHPGP